MDPCNRQLQCLILGFRKIALDAEGARFADRPVVIQVKADPNIAPLPPHVATQGEARFAASMR
jgi:hypothetical protein